MNELKRVQLQWVTDPTEPDTHVERATSGQVEEVYRDTAVRIVSDEQISTAEAKALAKRVEAAYAWDEKRLGWDQKGELAPRLNVAVLSEASFARFTGDTSGSVAGVTTGPNLFVVPERVLGKMSKEDVDTIAHELTHVQDYREAGRRTDSIPTYILEGRAYVDGDAYAKDTQRVASVLGQLTGRDAQAIVDGFRKAKDEEKSPRFVFIGEITGGLFVEFLRTKLGGHGQKDAMKKLSRAVEALGDGDSFEHAFQRELGVSLQSAEQEFVAWVKRTEGDPRGRLSGTIYGG